MNPRQRRAKAKREQEAALIAELNAAHEKWCRENPDPWLTCPCQGSSGCEKCGWSEGHGPTEA